MSLLQLDILTGNCSGTHKLLCHVPDSIEKVLAVICIKIATLNDSLELDEGDGTDPFAAVESAIEQLFKRRPGPKEFYSFLGILKTRLRPDNCNKLIAHVEKLLTPRHFPGDGELEDCLLAFLLFLADVVPSQSSIPFALLNKYILLASKENRYFVSHII